MSVTVVVLTVCLIVNVLGLPDVLSGDHVFATHHNFKLWQKYFGINFDNNIETRQRYGIWRQTVEANNLWNIGGHSWKRGLNKYSHLTFDEFNSMYLMAPQDCSATEHNMKQKPYIINADANPEKIDWRDMHVVSEVKDQGQCGSCYTFSSTGCLESHRALYNSSLADFMVELSEQQIVECAGAFNNFGCNGGLPSQVFEYIKYNGGINTEFRYIIYNICFINILFYLYINRVSEIYFILYYICLVILILLVMVLLINVIMIPLDGKWVQL